MLIQNAVGLENGLLTMRNRVREKHMRREVRNFSWLVLFPVLFLVCTAKVFYLNALLDFKKREEKGRGVRGKIVLVSFLLLLTKCLR
jgi:hypothetical protein